MQSLLRGSCLQLTVPARAPRRPSVLRVMGSSDSHLATAQEALQIAAKARTVAVLGIKTEDKASQAAYHVPAYLQQSGCRVIPVPVYFPEATQILGEPVVRDLRQIKEHVDVLDVFRRPQDIPAHVPDILALKPDCVWLQSGIRNEAAERQLAAAGITVVADRCLRVDRAAAPQRSQL